MGYWNETCMLTGLPIRPDEPVAGYFIARRRVPDGKTYPDAFYAPVTPAIYADYDGYGRLQDITPGHGADVILKSMGLRTKWHGKYDLVHGPDILTDAMRDGHDRGLFVPDPGKTNAYCPVFLVMVRREFHDEAIAAMLAHGCVPADEHDTGAFAHVEPVIRHAVATGKLDYRNVRGLVAFGRYLTLMRRDWHPTTGAGSQDEVEWRFQTDFYGRLLETAKDMYVQSRR